MWKRRLTDQKEQWYGRVHSQSRNSSKRDQFNAFSEHSCNKNYDFLVGYESRQERWIWIGVFAGTCFLSMSQMETRFWTINWGWRVEVVVDASMFEGWMYVYIYASITFLDDRINLSFQKFQITLIFHSKLVRFKIWSNLNDKQL